MMSKPDKYAPNGTPEDIEIGILHSTNNGYWVSNEGTKTGPSFHVWIPDGTCCKVDSAYADISLAVARCDYINKYHGAKAIR